MDSGRARGTGRAGRQAGRRSLAATPFVAVLVLAIAVRLVLASLPIVHNEDEVWQYLEPAYGWVTGLWIRTWDIRSGIRSWLMPVVLMPPVALGHSIAPRGTLHILLAREWMAALSLGVIWAFHSLGRRVGPIHGLVAAFVGATWAEIVYFAPRTSSDGLALSLFITALALLAKGIGPVPARARGGPVGAGLLAGGLLGLAFVLRLQLAPAIAFAVIATRGRDWRGYVPVGAGLVIGVGCDALANLAMGDTPFLWIWRNFTINVVQGKSAIFGTEPVWWYVSRIAVGWAPAGLFLFPALVVGARHDRWLLGVAVVILVTMSLIPHKEYRFITIAVAVLVYIAAVGSVDLALGAARRLGVDKRWVPAFLLPGWLMLSASVAVAGVFIDNWSHSTPKFTVLIRAGQVRGLCGIAVYRHPDIPLPAYSFINARVPVLMIDDPLSRRATHPPLVSRAYNVALATGQNVEDLARGGYRMRDCTDPPGPLFQKAYCLFVRPGGCTPVSRFYDYNNGLERLDR